MHSISDYQDIIDKEIKKLEYPAFPAGLYDPVKYVMSLGGKRIRPVLTLLACELFKEDFSKALPAALALEIFHNFTLVHDDLMDHALLRRGKPAVHKQWNDATAILSGDVMLVLAYELLLKVPEKYRTEAFHLFNDTAKKVCEGQQLDMLYENREIVNIDEYSEMISLKTAALLACCLKMGALIGGADADDQNNIYNFGYYAGLAFQVQDDLLDAYGTSDRIGKMIGGDIAANKKTFLTVKAFQVAEGDCHDELKYLFSDGHIDARSKICEVLAIYDTLNIKHLTEIARDEYYKHAFNYLEAIDIDDKSKRNLKDLSEMLIRREN